MDDADETNEGARAEETEAALSAAPEVKVSPEPAMEPDGWEPQEADREGWRVTAQALHIMYVCNIGAVTTGFLLGLVAAISGEPVPSASDPLASSTGFVLLIVMGFGLGILFAYARMLWVPKASGAHGRAVGAAACMAMVMVLSFVREFGFDDASGAEPAAELGAAALLSPLGDLFYTAATIFVVLFLKRVADHLGDFELGARAKTVLQFFGALIVLGLLISVLPLLITSSAEEGSVLLLAGALVVLILGLICLLKYLRLLSAVRDAIRFKIEIP